MCRSASRQDRAACETPTMSGNGISWNRARRLSPGSDYQALDHAGARRLQRSSGRTGIVTDPVHRHHGRILEVSERPPCLDDDAAEMAMQERARTRLGTALGLLVRAATARADDSGAGD